MKTCIAASRMSCFAWSVQMAGTVRTHKISSDQEDSLFGSENFACVSVLLVDTFFFDESELSILSSESELQSD